MRAQQIRLHLEMNRITEVVLKQLEEIESSDSEKRQKNVVCFVVPETVLCLDDTTLRNEFDKLNFLCETIDSDFSDEDIITCSRIGWKKGNTGRPRLLHVKFADIHVKPDSVYSTYPAE